MKLFQQLLVAPAAIGFLAPISASASEVNFDAISSYSNDNLEINVDSFRQNPLNNDLLAGGEGLVDSSDTVGGFSETTAASFGVDFLVGAADGGSSEALTFSYQMGIGLETSFTGEDSLSATIDIGDAEGPVGTGSYDGLNFDDTNDLLKLDGLTYTFPLGGATVMVGDATDISAVYTGACAYSAFTDYMGNCGTGSSVGVGGKGVTAAVSYAFDSGFSLAGGVSTTASTMFTDGTTNTDTANEDLFGIEAAYAADSYGVSVAYADDDSNSSTAWGINGYYTFDFATISAGVESVDTGTTAEGFFVGVSFPEVGAGSLDIGMGTKGNFADGATEYYIYEASYAYPVNDSVTITPGVYITEGTTDVTGVAVKTSFSF